MPTLHHCKVGILFTYKKRGNSERNSPLMGL